MKKLLLALVLALWAALPASAQSVGPAAIYCNKVVASGTLSASTVESVAGVSGKSISVCGFGADGLAAGSFQLVFGTGSSCTTSTAVTHVYTIAAGQHIIDHIPVASTSGAQGQSLCTIVTGASSLALTIYYSIN